MFVSRQKSSQFIYTFYNAISPLLREGMRQDYCVLYYKALFKITGKQCKRENNLNEFIWQPVFATNRQLSLYSTIFDDEMRLSVKQLDSIT